jgi:uncharacterized damage-inducible protein DinB
VPMLYSRIGIQDTEIPSAACAAFQHAVETYASETNKVASVWSAFTDNDLGWKPHPKSSSVGEILKHQLLSERRFFADFLGTPEPAHALVLPEPWSVENASARLVQLARRRLSFLAGQNEPWWLERARFFEVEREHAWILWRRILHTAHHRTQLTVYLRLLDRSVPSTYGPTADVTWDGADPTLTVGAVGRK